MTRPLLNLLDVADVSDKQVCLLIGHEVSGESNFTQLFPLLVGEPSAVPAALSRPWEPRLQDSALN